MEGPSTSKRVEPWRQNSWVGASESSCEGLSTCCARPHRQGWERRQAHRAPSRVREGNAAASDLARARRSSTLCVFSHLCYVIRKWLFLHFHTFSQIYFPIVLEGLQDTGRGNIHTARHTVQYRIHIIGYIYIIYMVFKLYILDNILGYYILNIYILYYTIYKIYIYIIIYDIEYIFWNIKTVRKSSLCLEIQSSEFFLNYGFMNIYRR